MASYGCQPIGYPKASFPEAIELPKRREHWSFDRKAHRLCRRQQQFQDAVAAGLAALAAVAKGGCVRA